MEESIEILIGSLPLFIVMFPFLIVSIVAIREEGKTTRLKMQLEHEKEKEKENHKEFIEWAKINRNNTEWERGSRE